MLECPNILQQGVRFGKYFSYSDITEPKQKAVITQINGLVGYKGKPEPN